MACVLVGAALVFALLWSLAHGYDISRYSREFSLAVLTAILLPGTAERNRGLLSVRRFRVLLLTVLAVNLLVLNPVFGVAIPWRINYLLPLILFEGLMLGLLVPRAVREMGPDSRGAKGLWPQMNRIDRILIFALVCGIPAAHAGQSGPTGSVVGTVQNDETNLPVRLAEIRLVPRSTVAETSKPHVMRVRGMAGMEGTFRMDGVPAGYYIAGALMAGYVTPGVSPLAMILDDDHLKPLLATMPVVHVAAGKTVRISLKLHRGAVISGRVRYADGSPATGAGVNCELPEIKAFLEASPLMRMSPLQETMMQFDGSTQNRKSATADEQGRFRIIGLLPGKYTLSTVGGYVGASSEVLMSDGGSGGLTGQDLSMYPGITAIYAPGTLRRKEAKVFDVRGNEEVTGADVNIDLKGLHTVRGRVLAGVDRHPPSRGMVHLDGRDLVLDDLLLNPTP